MNNMNNIGFKFPNLRPFLYEPIFYISYLLNEKYEHSRAPG